MGNRHSSRREFLSGQAAADHLLDLSQGVESSAKIPYSDKRPPVVGDKPAPTSPRASYLVNYGRKAMACEFEILLNAGQYANGAETALAALDLVEQLEDQLSIYREHSEVSEINRRASEGPVAVESRLFDLLVMSLELHAATEGAYDITSSALSRAWGFLQRSGRMPSEKELADALAKVGSQHVRLDHDHSQIEFCMAAMELSLNSNGKGYALDRCAELLLEAGIDDALMHGGQSSVLARGNCCDGDGGWKVGLRHPMRPERRLAEFVLRDEALGTSGSGTQFFRTQGKKFGHLLDPRTGQPATGVLSSTVIARSAAEADALATAFYVMGPEPTREFCGKRGDLAVLLTCPGARSGTIELHDIGLVGRNWSVVDAP